MCALALGVHFAFYCKLSGKRITSIKSLTENFFLLGATKDEQTQHIFSFFISFAVISFDSKNFGKVSFHSDFLYSRCSFSWTTQHILTMSRKIKSRQENCKERKFPFLRSRLDYSVLFGAVAVVQCHQVKQYRLYFTQIEKRKSLNFCEQQ